MLKVMSSSYPNQPVEVEFGQGVDIKYVPPKLVVLGRITDLTRANSAGAVADAGTRKKA